MYQAPNMVYPPPFRHPPPFYSNPAFLNQYPEGPQSQRIIFGNPPPPRMVPFNAINNSSPSSSLSSKYKIPDVYKKIPKKT